MTVTVKDGDKDSENVFVEQRKKTDNADSIEITGSGTDAKIFVYFMYKDGTIDTVQEHSVNFPAGTIN